MKARDAIFVTYGELNLPSIKTNASPLEISNWKKSPEVNASYKKLFKRMNDNNNSPLTISFIIERVFLEKEYTNVELAYVVAVCETTLNPNNDSLQLNESIMTNKINHYLVGFVICYIQINIFYQLTLIFLI